ncbi:hypothetical protein [Sphingomonas sp. Leaf22]|uniref:hypothetical protein n=1 Tax=Sphingomonas sp. Leaf22 TaxID=1735687 RepID=UPI0012E111F0|nr:hypothetical protein [Sphingomonas sp. Leaf22]
MAASVLAFSAPALAGEQCSLPKGWQQVLQRNPRYVVFGEIHGSRESPAFVGNFACALAKRGERVLVAVELSARADAAFQAAWRLPPAQFPGELMRQGWVDETDGRGSEAMRDLLIRLHAAESDGMPIAIVAFNGDRDDAQRAKFAHLPGQEPHEAAQAENVRAAVAAGRYDRVLVLTGNVHAQKMPIERRGIVFRPMAVHLAPAAQVVSLNMVTAGGSSWNCQMRAGYKPVPGQPVGSDAIECAAHPLRADAALDLPQFVSLRPLPGEAATPSYDGVFWLGPVNASPPALPER